MKTTLTLQLRAFRVTFKDRETGDEWVEPVVLDKDTLRAAQIVGQSSKELIYRLAARQGLHVLDIGAAEKREVTVNLEELYRLHSNTVRSKREKVED